MALRKQVALRAAVEPLQIPYPPGFQGEKSGHEDDEEFHLNTEYRFLTEEEIAIADAFVEKLTYKQSVIRSGAVMVDEDDPLLSYTHEQLDAAEKRAGLPSTKAAPGGGNRKTHERVLIMRERGYVGNGAIALPNSK